MMSIKLYLKVGNTLNNTKADADELGAVSIKQILAAKNT